MQLHLLRLPSRLFSCYWLRYITHIYLDVMTTFTWLVGLHHTHLVAPVYTRFTLPHVVHTHFTLFCPFTLLRPFTMPYPTDYITALQFRTVDWIVGLIPTDCTLDGYPVLLLDTFADDTRLGWVTGRARLGYPTVIAPSCCFVTLLRLLLLYCAVGSHCSYPIRWLFYGRSVQNLLLPFTAHLLPSWWFPLVG